LVEPRAMFRSKVEHMLMARIAKKGPSLHASAQVLGHKGDLAPLGGAARLIASPAG